MVCEQVGYITEMSWSVLVTTEPTLVVLTHIDICTKYVTQLQPQSKTYDKYRAEFLKVFLFIEAAADSCREQSTERVYPYYFV
jgi:hypothetical protein